MMLREFVSDSWGFLSFKSVDTHADAQTHTQSQIPLITGSIAHSIKLQYLSYSGGDFEGFHPAGTTCCTDWVNNDLGIGPTKPKLLLTF